MIPEILFAAAIAAAYLAGYIEGRQRGAVDALERANEVMHRAIGRRS